MDTNKLSNCKKFQANIFNKSKCQNCFRPKEHHSAEALESSKVLRKVSKCGYLFVAPDSFDFTNPMDRTRRWQRRFFVLYDDGELTYSVDENVGTIPQGIIDMNKCNDVHDAETLTSHQLAIAVRTPDKTTFIKGSDKHEIDRWFDVLAMYPRSLKTKHRRSPTYGSAARQPSPAGPSPAQPAPAPDPPPVGSRRPLSLPPGVSLPPPRTSLPLPASATIALQQQRRHTFTHPPTWTHDDDDATDTLSRSLTDESVFTSSAAAPGGSGGGASDPVDLLQQEAEIAAAGSSNLKRSRSDPRMADLVDRSGAGAAEAAVVPPPRAIMENVPNTYRSVRSMKHRDRAYQEGMRKSNSMHDLSRVNDTESSAMSSTSDPAPLYRSRSRDALYNTSPSRGASVSDSSSFRDANSCRSAPASPANTKPKTFFESLHESLINPPPPTPKTKNDRYMRLASIPNTKTIEQFTPCNSSGLDDSPEPSPRRSKSLDRPPAAKRRPTSPSPVSTERQPLRSMSSPRVPTASTPSSARPSALSNNIQQLRDKFLRLAAVSAQQPTVPRTSASRRLSRSDNPRAADQHWVTTDSRGPPTSSTTSSTTTSPAAGSSVSALRRQWSSRNMSKLNQNDPIPSHTHGDSSRSNSRNRNVNNMRTSQSASPVCSSRIIGRHQRTSTSSSTSSSTSNLASNPSSISSSLSHLSQSHVSTGSSKSLPSYTHDTATTTRSSKFTVRVPPPYRTASLSSAPTYALPRAPLLTQEPLAAVSRQSSASPRSASAPAPPRAKVGTESSSTTTNRSSTRPSLADSYSSSRDSATPAYIVNGRTKNETDEHKMAKSGELAARMGHLADSPSKQRHDPYDDLIYMKKGWLLKQHQDQEWSKHWFVLSGSSLRFYKDSRAEETNDEDGCIDIASCYEIGETDVTRNYGFKIRTGQGDHVLSAMTSGIRSNWMQAIQKCMETSGHSTHLDFDSSPQLDFSPSSSTRSTSYSSPSRSSSRHSDYSGLQRDTSRRHTVNVTSSAPSLTPPPPPRGQYSGFDSGASPRSDNHDYNRPSRARRSLDAYAADGQKMSAAGLQRPIAPAPPPPSVGTAPRFVSCTWPYESSSSGASGSERDPTPDSSSQGSRSRRNSNISQYLEDEEDTRSRERSQEEEQALDEVEHNIRRIHRRSLSDHSSRHKPPHFDKFESGTAFEGADPAPVSPGRSSNSSTPRRQPPEDRGASARAPSAKIKEKTRARSPRPRSPPPLEVKAVPLEEMAARQDEEDGASPSLDNPPTTTTTTTSTEGAAAGGREDALVDLLETEVESLKNQLERTRTELTDTKQENHNLKFQLRSTHRDKDDLITDLETDKTRYLSQIEDIQDQMEHTTDFLQRRLVEQEAKMAEHESHADLTKLQVQTLKKQLKEAKDNMEAHEEQLMSLQAKLNSDSTAQTLEEVSSQKEHLEKMCEELETKLKALEEEVERLESELSRKRQQLNQREQRLQDVQEALEHSEQHIVDLEHDLEELHSLRTQLKVKEEKMADAEEELSAVRSQLSEQDQELAVRDELHQAEKDQLEATFALERSKLEDHLLEAEQQLELTRRQSTMSSSLNSNMADILREKDETIAQLEEKLIENDNKIEELGDEINIEIEENTQLQQNLEASYNETAQGKRQIDQLNKDISQLEKALKEAREEVQDLKNAERKQQEDIEHSRQEQLRMKEQVDALQRENSELRHALEELKQADMDNRQIADLTKEYEEQRSQSEAFREECAKLEKEMAEANEKVSHYETELAELRHQHEFDIQKRCQELAEAQKLTTDLQSQLLSAEETANENKQLLEQSMAAVQPFSAVVTDETAKQQLEEDYSDLKAKHDRSIQEVKRLRNELREAHISIDDMEIASTGVKQQVKAMEADHQQQLSLMSSRIQDLTAKLAAADKKVRKLEKRASRRESKLKLRRDSIEAGEKNSGSSGEAEQDRDSDVKVPDEEVMTLLKAVVGSEPSNDTQMGALTALDTSTSSNSKLEDSINTETSESDLDPELAARCKHLEERLAISEAKVKDLCKALELTTPEGQNQELIRVQEQNKKYEQQIIFLTAKLNKSSASASVETARAKRAATKDEPEKMSKDQTHTSGENSNQMQSALVEMQVKLAKVVHELGSTDASTSTADYTNTISSLRSQLETILADISDTSEGKPHPSSVLSVSPRLPRTKIEDPVKVFAEKLSLEAVLVGEMAHLIKTGQEHMMSEREVYLYEIAQANHRILELEQKVKSVQSLEEGASDSDESVDALTKCTGLLAEKMVLQSHIHTLMEKYKEQEDIRATHTRESGDSAATNMSQEALFKGQLAQKLQNQGATHLTIPTRVLVRGELTFILNKLKDRMADSRTDQERIDLLDHELELSHQRLCERANLMCDGVEAFKISALDKVASTIVNNKAKKEEVNRHIGEMIKRYAAEYRKASVDAEKLGVVVESIPESRRHTMIESSIQQEIEETIDMLSERCEGELEGESIGSEQELERILGSVCEVLAQKAVIDGHIAYITEQIQQHQQHAPQDTRAPNPLRRHDSGIIVSGSSMPTSPTAEDASPASSTDGDMTSLAARLSREAVARRQLAQSLQRKDGNPNSIQAQMAKIAAELVNVDVDLVRHRRLISDYADVIAQEAMFQAQMTYLTEQLRMQHENQLSLLQRQIDTRSPITSAVDEEQIQALEAEILRLSTLLANNDELLQQESAKAQHRMEQMEEELQRQEDFFQKEVANLEERYKNRLRETEGDLHEARDELDKLKIGAKEEKKEFISRINSLERDLQKVGDQRLHKGGNGLDMQKRVDELEEQLEDSQNEMEASEVRFQQEIDAYTKKVSQLEEEITSLTESHAKDMIKVREELRIALNNADTSRLEEEVTSLHSRLKEERILHQQQLEKMQADILGAVQESGDHGDEAALAARAKHLEFQIEGMQADYEQELAIQRAAHRRELARSKEDLLTLLSQAEAKSMQVDEVTIRKRYTKEIEHIKQIYDSGFASMEKSHQRVLRDMRAAHKRELEKLRAEKDQLLIEETKATQAALDAMKKAHEAEVQKERNKFLDAISKTYSNNDVDSIQRQHEEDLEFIQNEIRQLSEQLSIKCLENAALEERLDVQTKALGESRSRTHELMARNEELSLRLRQDIERLSKMIKQPNAPGSPYQRQGEPPEVYELRVAMKLKDADKQQLQEEIDDLRKQLHSTTEELEDSMERYQEMHTDQVRMRSSYENQLQAMRQRLDDVMEEPKLTSLESLQSERDRSSGDSGDCASQEEAISGVLAEAHGDSASSSCVSSPRPNLPSPRVLPQVSNEARNVKRLLWRQRHNLRAHSNPGPASLIRRLSLPVEQSEANRSLPMEDPIPDSPQSSPQASNSLCQTRKERSNRHTTVGINVASLMFQEKL